MKKIFSLVALIFCFGSCDFGDTNVSPTQLTVAPTKGLLTNSLQSLASLTLGNGVVRYGLYIQHLSEGPYPGASLYSERNLSFSTWYTGPLYNLQTIINYNEEGNSAANANGSKDNQIAVARILKAYFFLKMTDIWGDLPYTDALKGNGTFIPAYSSQEAIYTDLFKELTEAQAQIKTDESAVVGDILLSGNMAAWKRFANTMRLTMALRISKANPTKGKTEFEAAIAAGVINSNAENIKYTYLSGDPNNYNSWYNNYSVSNRNDYAISNTMTAYMAPKNDPRLAVYGEVLAGGSVIGLTYGRNQAVNIPDAFSRIGGYFRSAGSSLDVYSYAQVLFCKAEAAKIGYLTGGDTAAEQFYKDAIKASWEEYGVFNADKLAAYYALADIKYAPATAVKQILTEKWVHSYLSSLEVWADWRRTGFPTLTPAQDAVDSRGIPFRLGYPTNESSLNKDNYNTAVTALGGTDDNYAKFWWAK